MKSALIIMLAAARCSKKEEHPNPSVAFVVTDESGSNVSENAAIPSPTSESTIESGKEDRTEENTSNNEENNLLKP